ncbi:flippase-like domain-containing protein [Bosea sp. 2RAB26]|uniref:flippase-like domain-containing protein n=1 Tax=Bosea sp. 2RAB26 TaxID=3237476 RepID=UPI003F929999
MIKPAVQLGAAVGLGILMARHVDFTKSFRLLSRVDLVLFAGATLLLLGQQFLAAVRWRLVSRVMGARLPLPIAFDAYLKANFVNQVVPSTIGGDAVRIYIAVKSGMSAGLATIAVLIDRLLGLIALAALALIGALALYQHIPSRQIGLALSIASAGLIIGGALLSMPRIWFRRISALWALHTLSDWMAQVLGRPRVATLTMAYSILGHVLMIIAFDLLGRSIGVPIGFIGSLETLPAMMLATVVPLSFGGWGVREGAAVLILPAMGYASQDEALAVSILLGLSNLTVGMVGGLSWLIKGRLRIPQFDQMGPSSMQVQPVALSGPAQIEAGGAVAPRTYSDQLAERKQRIKAHAEATAETRDAWIQKNNAYFDEDYRFLRHLIPEGSRVLDLGCGTGALLAALKPSHGLGVDLSARMIDCARIRHPDLEFVVGDVEDPSLLATLTGPFDYIILSDTIGQLDDIEMALKALHPLCTRDTRLVITHYSHIWEPAIYLADRLGLRHATPHSNIITSRDFSNILELASFEVIRDEHRQLIPFSLFGIGPLVNRYIGTLPLLRRLGLRKYIVARSLEAATPTQQSVSILIPCRNERGNVESAVTRLPQFGSRQEIIFIEGNSSDNTYEECLRVMALYPDRNIKAVQQAGKGKGDAMRTGYATATGDIMMILDADLSVPPEMLPRFYDAIASGKGEFVNGSRLIYPMQSDAMRPLNLIANRGFAVLFSYLLNQRFTDTLCGTKIFRKSDYDKIEAGRSYFGDFDPFGDFDLIFGAAKQNLKIVEIPVHYMARTYGETQISRFRDGFLLIRMVIFGWFKLRAV